MLLAKMIPTYNHEIVLLRPIHQTFYLIWISHVRKIWKVLNYDQNIEGPALTFFCRIYYYYPAVKPD